MQGKGRKRDENGRMKILTAMLDLVNVEERFSKITIEGLAKRANVSKATIYKWWSSKEDVFIEALLYFSSETMPPFAFEEVGAEHFFEQFQERILDIRRFHRTNLGRTMLSLSLNNQEFEHILRTRHRNPKRQIMQKNFIKFLGNRATDEDINYFLDVSFSFIYNSSVIHKQETDEEIIRKIQKMFYLLFGEI